jgi:hypothetical protein
MEVKHESFAQSQDASHIENYEVEQEKNTPVHNQGPFKGDDSDGAVEWTLKKIIAAVSLAGLYTGIL